MSQLFTKAKQDNDASLAKLAELSAREVKLR